jgi:3-oxoacyl-[acyl-carrier-protein] synthase-1/3-oxoacyl-[acyl-carrier-protein] synthase II
MMSQGKREIAISGMGCCSAAGPDSKKAWDRLWQGDMPLPGPPPFACEQPQPVFIFPQPLNFASGGLSGDLKKWNRTILLTLRATLEALAMAGIEPASLPAKRVGIVLGTTVRCHFHDDEYFLAWKKGHSPDQEAMGRFLNENLATAIQDIFQCHGPTTVVTNACASGTDAIGLGRSLLRHDLCDLVICGGADELSRLAFHGFSSLLLTSDAACMPFAKERSGLNLGEGAGILILEKDSLSRVRGANPVGWLLGYGAGSDGYHPTAPHPEGRGLQQAIHIAMVEAGVDIQTIALINGHGTGTQANDLAETTALASLGFTSTPLISTKGATGHTLGAAGGIEAVLCLRALQERRTFGTIGCLEPDPNLPFKPVTQNDRFDLSGRIGLSHSLAFGGGNAALVLEAAP